MILKLRKINDGRYAIDYNKKVFVYRNLHKNCWSVKQGGLVKAHSTDQPIILRDVEFRVNEKARQKVLKEKRKNVHAGAVGYLLDGTETLKQIVYSSRLSGVTYNPYKYKNFVDAETEEPVYKSERVVFMKKRVLANLNE